MLVLLLLSIVDYYAGYDFGFFVFYFIPISIVSWYTERIWGIVFALLSAVLWLIIDLLPPKTYITLAAEYWNATMRLTVFMIIAIGFSNAKSRIERENKLNKELEERTEELLITNRDLQAYTYSIAHDLKNPLTVITAFAEIVKEEESNLDSEQKDALERIISECRRMREIIEDLLRLSKIGAKSLDMVDVNLSEIALDSTERLRTVYKNVNYLVEIQPHLHAKADAGLVRIVFDNLIGNAMKFSSKANPPQIYIGAGKQNNNMVFHVRDNGVGFDQEKADTVFDPFIRLHSKKDFPGTGIGLAIVRKIIERHQGRIWVNSQKGSGTTFYFTLSS
jgi:signal transduction histidine kinase